MIIQPAETQFDATYFNGRQALRQPGRVELANEGLHLFIGDCEEPVVWPYGVIRVSDDGSYGEAVRIEAPDGQMLIIESSEFTPALHQFRGGPVKVPLELRGVPTLLLMCAAIVAIAGGYYFWGVRWASEFAVRFMPPSIEDRLGKAVLAAMAPEARRCKGGAGLEPVVNRLTPLLHAPYPIRIYYVNSPVVNAFAAPGGYVVVFRGLLDASKNAEEFAGVLAHEMQHVQLKHTTRAIAREFSGRALLSLLSVDSSGTPTAAQAAGKLANLAYQRSDEEQADLEGAHMLAQAGIRTDGLASFLKRMQGEADGFQYLSTHPALAERVEKLKALSNHNAPALMTDEKWEAARQVCSGNF